MPRGRLPEAPAALSNAEREARQNAGASAVTPRQTAQTGGAAKPVEALAVQPPLGYGRD